MYSVSIPLGATINMDGAAITIAVMTLAAANTMGIPYDIPTALILCVLATLGAGGSLLLIPLASSLFGISNDIAMQVVAVGFIIGVVQDSMETALNSSSDVLLTEQPNITHGKNQENRCRKNSKTRYTVKKISFSIRYPITGAWRFVF